MGGQCWRSVVVVVVVEICEKQWELPAHGGRNE